MTYPILVNLCPLPIITDRASVFVLLFTANTTIDIALRVAKSAIPVIHDPSIALAQAIAESGMRVEAFRASLILLFFAHSTTFYPAREAYALAIKYIAIVGTKAVTLIDCCPRTRMGAELTGLAIRAYSTSENSTGLAVAGDERSWTLGADPIKHNMRIITETLAVIRQGRVGIEALCTSSFNRIAMMLADLTPIYPTLHTVSL